MAMVCLNHCQEHNMQGREGTTTSVKIKGIFRRLGIVSVRIAIVSYWPVSTCKQILVE